jgi:hypothetical protein
MPYVNIHRGQQGFSQLLRSTERVTPTTAKTAQWNHKSSLTLLGITRFPDNFEGRAGARSILGNSKATKFYLVAVQAGAYTDKTRRDGDETKTVLKHCNEQPSGSNKARASPKCIREALRIVLTIIPGRL